MSELGGEMPVVSYPIEVFDGNGYHTIVCTAHDVPFFGHWDGIDVFVETVWGESDFPAIAKTFQDWPNVTVISSAREQLEEIDAALNEQVRDDPCIWLTSEPPFTITE
jgi:hypothetical protein